MAEPNLSDPARLFGTLGMKNAQAEFDKARKDAQTKGFDKKRLDAASEPVTSDTGVPDKLVETVAAKRKAASTKDLIEQRKGDRRSRMYQNTKVPMDPTKLVPGSED